MAHFPLPPADSADGTFEWTEQEQARIVEILARYPTKKAAIMPLLWMAQDRFKWLPLGALKLVANTLELSPSHVLGVASFYTMYRKQPTGTYLLQVCHTLSCDLAGCEKILAHLEKRLGVKVGETTPDGQFTVARVECLAACGSGPMLQVNEAAYHECLTTEKIDALLEALKKDELDSFPTPEVDQWTYSTPGSLSRNWGKADSHTLKVVRESGGYGALARALKMDPADVTTAVLESGLRGRGGAGFPTGRKWSFVPDKERRGDKPVYLLCNADESEPGTYKDRFCMWNDPHMLIEGMLIAAWALECHTAYIYLRGEFRYIQERVDEALAEARRAGLLGKNILSTGFDCEIYTHLGAGAYICGEETGMISSLEGDRGQPKLKPPFPAVEGAWAAPTVVNNVETLAAVPWIIQNGASAYKAIGTEKSSGTKLFSCSGHIQKPGVYEIPLGYPMLDLLNKECGGLLPGRTLKAVIPGGSSVPVMTAEEVGRANMDYESINEVAGSYLGSGGFIVMDDTTDMVAALTNLLRFYAHESCGQCTPCREGCGWMYDILVRLRDGYATASDLDTLLDLADNIHSRTICFFGASAAMPVQSFLAKFKDEFLQRIKEARTRVPVAAPSAEQATGAP